MIINETFCIYCQKEYETPKRLHNHINKKHQNTYASAAIIALSRGKK